MFGTYFELGIRHIADLTAFDHLLFIAVLVAVYRFKQIGKVAILVTAFTIGHSITLALATLDVIAVPTDIIEFLIPVTIFLTALVNILGVEGKVRAAVKYFIALGFGLIHGMGFSNYLRHLLGEETSLVQPLLAFNLGLEVGQLGIVVVSLILALMFNRLFGASQRSWEVWVSGVAMGISFMLMRSTAFW